MSNFKIRPHHGLCLQFFKGHGYSTEFVENMTEILENLSKNPKITLVSQGDSVCKACPHDVDGICNCSKKVSKYDQAVLHLCHLQPGDTLTWQEFSHLVETKILDKNLRESICGDCQWTQYCI